MNLKQILEDFNLNRPTFNDIGTDKNTIHSYVDGFYEKEFSLYQDKNISLLEIGIEFGASLKLWSEYFKNPQNIIGIDNVNRLVSEYQNVDNVQIIFENAYDMNLVSSLPNFDIIIDDGPHTLESQLNALELYIPKLKNNGLLIIEDIQSCEWISLLEEKFYEVCKVYNLKNLSYEFVDLTNFKGRYDDLMFVVRAK